MSVLLPGDLDQVSRNRLARHGMFGVRTRIWLSDLYGTLVDVIEDGAAISGNVEYNEDYEVSRRCTLEVNRPQRFDPLTTFIKVQIERTTPDGHVDEGWYGHYVLNQPTVRRVPGRISGSFEAQDITQVLASQTLEGYRALAGTDTGLAARQIALESGLDDAQVSIPATQVPLVSDYRPDPGTSRLTAMTRLLNDSGFYKPTADGRGVISSQRYIDIQTAQVVNSYSTRESDLQLLHPITETPDLTRLKTKVVVRNLAPDRPPIWGSATITNAEHPLYNSKIQLVETIDSQTVTTNAEAAALARAAMSERSSYYRKLTIATVLDLNAGARDIIALELTDGDTVDASGRWWRRAWKVALRGVSATTESEVWRVEEWQ